MTRKKYLQLFLLAALFSIAASVKAAPTGFSNQTLATGLTQPTDFAFASDGRIFITLQNGQVDIFKNGQIVSPAALTLSVGTGGDRGLLSLALDPGFATNGFIYLLYTSPALHERVSRFTVSGDSINPASEVVLLENPATWSGFLNAGTIRYNGGDGKLYISLGSNGTGTGAQDLSILEGKLLRINLDGTIPTDNPFYNFSGAQKAIYSYGFRNPWKMNIDPARGILIGDVGENTWEKIVRAAPGANFGWPTFEGDCTPNCNGVTPPLYVYPHNGAGAAVVGGDVIRGANFPSQYQGTYFYGDYVQSYIKNVSFNTANGVANVTTFDTGDGTIAGINSGPDGCLYYLDIFPGELHKICYNTTAINESINPNTNAGALPLTVQFTPTATTDSSGSPLNFSWNFGDGSAVSTAVNPSHTYTTQGVYNVTLTASNSNGTATATTKIWAGYQPLNITINSPIDGSHYNDGDTINFSGSATDPQSGPVPASNLTWTIIFHHNTHIHAPTTIPGVANGSYVIPNNDEPSANQWYEIDLTATNSAGLSTTKTVNIYPNVVTLSFATNPTGAQITLDSQPFTAPYQQQSVVGYLHPIGTLSPQNLGGTSYNFASWSDGGTQNHTITTPNANTTYTASFTSSGNPPPPPATGINLTASTDAPSYTPGAPLTVTASGNSATSLPQSNFDIEIWNNGQKVSQNASLQNFTAGQPVTVNWQTTAPTISGNSTIKLGVFSSDWSHLYQWNDNAATFSVGNTTTTPPTTTPPSNFSDKVTMDKTSYAPSSAASITTQVTPNQNINNALVDTEIFNTSGSKVGQNFVTTNLVAGTPYSTLWNTTSPNATGNYTIKVGVFNNSWSQLYFWDNQAATLTVSNTTLPPTDTSPPTVPTGLTATAISASQINLSWSASTDNVGVTGYKIFRNGVQVSTTGGTTYQDNGLAASTTYSYTVSAFDAANNNSAQSTASTATTQAAPPPSGPPVFAISATMPKNNFNPGEAGTLTVNITSSQNLSNVNIDLEIDNSGNVMVMQKVVSTTLVANQTFTINWNLNVPSQQGSYFTKIGIFNSDWSQLYFWQNNSFQFTVGTPPGPPQPGQTYTVTVLQPANGSTVQGTVEVRAVINGLDINSYNIGWSTGGSAPFNLDTDPVTQQYKHAWIDFSTWNWIASQNYPISFIATNQSGGKIGQTDITVHVQH